MEKNRIILLDLLRGIAAYLVAVSHYCILEKIEPVFFEIISSGTVEIFFILSGFVLGPQIIFCLNTGSLKNIEIFLKRRWLRTIPPYIFALLIICMLKNNIDYEVVYYFFYCQNLLHPSLVVDWYSISWSLSVEEWYYVLFPAIGLLVTSTLKLKQSQYWLIAVSFIALIAIIRGVFSPVENWGEQVRRVVIYRLDSIAFGFLLYLNFDRIMSNLNLLSLNKAIILLCFSLTASASLSFQILYSIGKEKNIQYEFMFPLIAALLGGVTVVTFSFLNMIYKDNKIICVISLFLGKISYSIYLFHLIVFQIMKPTLANFSIYFQFFLINLILIGFCTAFFYLFEKPILSTRPQYIDIFFPKKSNSS